MSKYFIIDQWKKLDTYTAEAPDGSKVWFDIRELVGFEQPDGYYISLGAVIFNKAGKSSFSSNTSSTDNKIMHVYIGKKLCWEKDGYDTGEEISGDNRRILLDNIKNGLNLLGFAVEYISKHK